MATTQRLLKGEKCITFAEIVVEGWWCYLFRGTDMPDRNPR